MLCSVCDVTAWVREGQQYPEPGKVPHTEACVAYKLPDEETRDLVYVLAIA